MSIGVDGRRGVRGSVKMAQRAESGVERVRGYVGRRKCKEGVHIIMVLLVSWCPLSRQYTGRCGQHCPNFNTTTPVPSLSPASLPSLSPSSAASTSMQWPLQPLPPAIVVLVPEHTCTHTRPPMLHVCVFVYATVRAAQTTITTTEVRTTTITTTMCHDTCLAGVSWVTSFFLHQPTNFRATTVIVPHHVSHHHPHCCCQWE